jgi:hypothetical protein
MNTETMLTIFAIIAALGLVTVVAVEVLIAQEAEAQSPIGECARSLGNASASFCHRLQTQTEQGQEQGQGQGQDRDR